jgi:hypothetical protein
MAGFNISRLELAMKRIKNVLRAHITASARILENKISDAGPTNQRIDPHLLTRARALLEATKNVEVVKDQRGTPWYYLTGTDSETLEPRLKELQAVHDETQSKQFTLRLGQALEIAVSKALLSQKNFHTLGHFADLNEHNDSTLYKKEEPPSNISGNICEGKLDFVLFSRTAGVAGIEVKNVREWIYSQSDEVIQMIKKCCALDAIPVLITRRYSYEAFSVLTECGVIIHQMYNRRYANYDKDLANRVRDKKLLGYHDVRVGNDPDDRLLKFVHVNLPQLVDAARSKFEEKRELLSEYVNSAMGYGEFVAKVRGRDVREPEQANYDGFGVDESELYDGGDEDS